MAEDNPPPPCAECFGGAHEPFLTNSQNLSADEPAGGEPPGRSNEHYQLENRNSLPHSEDEQKNEEPGNCESSVNHPHERHVHDSSPVDRDQTDHRAECDGKCHREQCHTQ